MSKAIIFDTETTGITDPEIIEAAWVEPHSADVGEVSTPSNYELYRGKCKEMSEALCANDTSLTLVRGFYHDPFYGKDWNVSPVLAYKRTWELINGQGSWDSNPFCWVIEFKVISK
jgi:hypothetical protein